MQRSLARFLDKLKSRSRLTNEECHAVISLTGKPERHEPHKSIVHLGDSTVSATLIVEGLCARVAAPSEARRQITAIYIEGDMPDLHSLFEPEAAAALETMTRAVIVRIAHADLREVMRSYPAVAEAFSRYLMADAAITQEWLINLGGREARGALAHLFCEMAVRMNKVENNSFSYHFPVSQQQLSEATGLSAVHVNRSLQSLRQEGLIRVEHGMVQIPDWAALKQAAHFNDRYLGPVMPKRFAN